MGRGAFAGAVLSLTLVGAAIGYVIATAYLTFRYAGLSGEVDFLMLARDYGALAARRPNDATIVNLIIGGFAVAGLLLSGVLAGEALTRFGETRWQSRRDMRRNGFFGSTGTGFILGKTGRPGSRAALITSKVFPHALIVAPTGRGKTTGFTIPNMLTFKGSAVVLDVKGEIFDATARHRVAEGDNVFRFAPTDWRTNRTHRYNPLQRIYELENPNQQQMELQLLASLFLQSDSDRVQGLLKGGIDLFVAAGLLAFEREVPTLGEIYRITASGGDKQKEYNARRLEVQNPAARLIFERMASTNNDTLTSYVSLLMTSGLDQWSNPAIDDATATSDFDFRTIRKTPFTVYLVVEPLMVKPLASLIRLFFSDLIASLQDHQPGKDEPWPVMILLDEFNRLGKMPIVVDSIETLRSYRGHLAIVTQTIPALDEIYGENARRSLQGNAGVKLYLTPSDEKTVEELSNAVGKTTKRVVTRSRAVSRNPFEGRSTSERTEEAPLLTEDQARRMPLDDIVMVIDAQMPVRAKRIQYFKDRYFQRLFEAQTGAYPLPQEGTVPTASTAVAANGKAAERSGVPARTKAEPTTEPDISEDGAGATPPGRETAEAPSPAPAPANPQPASGPSDETMSIRQASETASPDGRAIRPGRRRRSRAISDSQLATASPAKAARPLSGGQGARIEDREALQQGVSSLTALIDRETENGVLSEGVG
ncbi:MAG: type IV secretory system conjugative DNA transfer family protein [Limimaricola soesokkakensis]|uniref:type IV secretory system conjugative DNA transfer family protein n=1 Tax=Limimaricola soesokkakensis TaxID=1343159 RepID=UPI0040587E8B